MDVETKVKQTLNKIKLKKSDRILVALSGGKDSIITAYLLKKFGYKIEAIHLDLGMGNYSKKCLEVCEKLCKDLEIKLHIYDIKKEMGSSMCYLRLAIQSRNKLDGKNMLKNCAICGVIKKWILNKESRRLKVDKIATGHNLDDEAQTILINIFKASLKLSANSGPITRNSQDKKKKFITRIKPLYYIPENEIKKYAVKNKLPVIYEKCPCAIYSYRIEIRNFLENEPNKIKENIIKNFERISKRVNKLKDTRADYCEICGEPSRNKICKKCKLIKI